MKDRIKKIRKELGYTQQTFSDKLGISKFNIINYEAGRRVPNPSTVNLICTKFNVNENWLRTGQGEMYGVFENDSEIASVVKTIVNNIDDKPYLLDILKWVESLPEETVDNLFKLCAKYAPEDEED